MSTDLETELRDALHSRAASITQADLRYATAQRSTARRPPRRPSLPWVLAAAAVVAAIVGVGFAVLGFQGSDRAAGPGDAPQLRGTAWSVVAVTVDGRRQPITSAEVSVAFHLDHRFDGTDGINAYSGRWRQDGGRVTISDVGGTLAGYGGHDPAVLAAQRGIGALTGRLTATLAKGVLRLSTGSVTVELTARAGFHDSAAATPSSTPSPTGHPSHSYVNGSELAPPGAS